MTSRGTSSPVSQLVAPPASTSSSSIRLGPTRVPADRLPTRHLTSTTFSASICPASSRRAALASPFSLASGSQIAPSTVASSWTSSSLRGLSYRPRKTGIGSKSRAASSPRGVGRSGRCPMIIDDAMSVRVPSPCPLRTQGSAALVLGWYRPRGHPDLPLPDLPDRHAFLSVPLGHSRKPSVLGTTKMGL
jgi:hypothetical protein